MTKSGPTSPATATAPSARGGSKAPRAMARAQRLATALKENLRRRKVQVQERARDRAAEAQAQAGREKQAGQQSE